MLRRFGKKLVILPQSYILCINVFDGQKILKQYNLFIRLMRMKNHFCKMGKVLLSAALLSTVGITSCSDDDFHLKDYEDNAPTFLGQSLYHELARRGNFQTVVKLIDDLEYAEVLSKTGSKTMFVAPDSAWEKFFQNNSWGVSSYEELSKNQKKVLLNTSMLNNAYVMEMLANTEGGGKNLCLRQVTSATAADSVAVWDPDLLPKTQSPVDVDWFKNLRNAGQKVYMALDATTPMMTHFLEGHRLSKGITRGDVAVITGQPWSEDEGDRSYIYDTRVIEPDVVCLNGYLHVLDRVLVAPGNMAEMIRSNGRTNYFSAMLDRFAAPYYNDQLTKQYKALNEIPADSVFEKRYIAVRSQGNSKIERTPDGAGFVNPVYLPFDPGWNAYSVSSSTAKEEDMAAMFVPTDEAMVAYFIDGGGKDFIQRYGTLPNTEENLLTNLYQIPLDLMGSLINNLMKDSFNESVPSKYLTIVNDAQDEMFMSYTTVDEFKNHLDGCLVANNGVVYLTKTVDAPADYAAVIAPALISENTKLVRAVAKADDNFVQGDSYASAPLKQYFSTYLKAMQSKFSFFVPVDEGLNSYGYVDPAGFASEPYGKAVTGTSKRYYWRWAYDDKTKGAVIPVEATAYNYDIKKGQEIPDEFGRGGDKKKNQYTSKPTDALTANANGAMGATKRLLLIEMMDQHIVVHDDDQGIGASQKYYLSRSGAPVYVDSKTASAAKGGLGVGVDSKVKGGYQLMLDKDEYADNDHASTVLEAYDKTGTNNGYGNGMTYLIDRPMQPTMRSVYNVMTVPYVKGEEIPFSKFFELADPAEVSTTVLKYAGFINEDMTANEQQQEKLKYHIFARSGDNVGNTASYCPAANEGLVRFFNNYNYTVYVPTNEQVEKAMDNGLMTWAQIEKWIADRTMDDDPTNDNDENPGFETGLSATDTVKVQAMVTTLVNFMKYHFQNRSVFCDDVNNAGAYQTSCIDNVTDSYLSLSITQSPSELKVADAFGNEARVVTENGAYNILARDINYDNKSLASIRSVKNSSYVVVHQIDKYLNFNNKAYYQGYKDPGGQVMPEGRFDFWNYTTEDNVEDLVNYVAKYRLR